MKKELMNIEIDNIIAYMNKKDSIIRNPETKLSIKFAWKLRKNLKRLSSIYDTFVQARNEIINYYSSDEYSTDIGDGKRKVKDEYLNEYNKKISELCLQKNEVTIDMAKIEDVMPGSNQGLTFEELNILSFMIEDEVE